MVKSLFPDLIFSVKNDINIVALSQIKVTKIPGNSQIFMMLTGAIENIF